MGLCTDSIENIRLRPTPPISEKDLIILDTESIVQTRTTSEKPTSSSVRTANHSATAQRPLLSPILAVPVIVPRPIHIRDPFNFDPHTFQSPPPPLARAAATNSKSIKHRKTLDSMFVYCNKLMTPLLQKRIDEPSLLQKQINLLFR